MYKKDQNNALLLRSISVDGEEPYFKICIREDEISPSDSVETFLQGRDWLWYENYFEVKYKAFRVSKDGFTVNIKTRPMNKAELRKAQKN
jgi:hypothetical protein